MYLRYTGRIWAEENPWIVVTTGVSTRRAVGQRQEVEAVVDQVELARPLEDLGDVEAFPYLGIGVRRFGVSPAATDTSCAVVTESAVANRVTSTPRATRPSASSETNCSQGP